MLDILHIFNPLVPLKNSAWIEKIKDLLKITVYKQIVRKKTLMDIIFISIVSKQMFKKFI